MRFTVSSQYKRKERYEIQTELCRARIAGASYVLLFEIEVVDHDFDSAEEIPGRRIDESDLNSPVPVSYEQYFVRVKPEENPRHVKERELGLGIKHIRSYKVPREPPAHLTSYNLEDYLADI